MLAKLWRNRSYSTLLATGLCQLIGQVFHPAISLLRINLTQKEELTTAVLVVVENYRNLDAHQ